MAYQCPGCGQPVRRGYSRTAQHTAGLIGALFYAAFGSFQCAKCGTVARSEFPAEVRTRMATGIVASPNKRLKLPGVAPRA